VYKQPLSRCAFITTGIKLYLDKFYRTTLRMHITLLGITMFIIVFVVFNLSFTLQEDIGLSLLC